MTEVSFIKASYAQHQASYAHYQQGNEKANHANTWLRQDNVNAFRVNRVYGLLDPWVALFPKSTWMTVGDGRYGLDAHYLKQQGVQVVATDIADDLLKEGQAAGYIDAYKQENAEQLSFSDNQFDFSFCKEAYHHFPRPLLALYEMLRVVKQGAILIEPIDREIVPWYQIVFLNLKNILKIILGKSVQKYFFESDGNFLYAISKREIEKVALGLGFKQVVFKGINDIYLEGMEYAPLDKRNSVYKKMQRKQKVYDLFSRLKLIPYNLLFAAILKEPLDPQAEASLTQAGYEVINLPENPYIKLNNQ